VLNKLPQTQAQAIRLRYFDALSIRAIARTLEITDMAAASLLKRGLRNLREKLHEPSWQ